MINLSKSDIGQITKSVLDKINNALVGKTKINQWKNSANTFKWYTSISNKKASSFVNFDVENFQLSTNAITYARSLIDITE